MSGFGSVGAGGFGAGSRPSGGTGSSVLQLAELLAAKQAPKKHGLFGDILHDAGSVVGKGIHVLQTPQYVITGALEGLAHGQGVGGAVHGALHALPGMGWKRVGTGEVLKDLGVHNRYVRGFGGFVGDTLLDPTTYLTLGAAPAIRGLTAADKAGDLAMRGLDGLNAAERADKAAHAATILRGAGENHASRAALAEFEAKNAANLAHDGQGALHISNVEKAAANGDTATLIKRDALEQELAARQAAASKEEMAHLPQNIRASYSVPFGKKLGITTPTGMRFADHATESMALHRGGDLTGRIGVTVPVAAANAANLGKGADALARVQQGLKDSSKPGTGLLAGVVGAAKATTKGLHHVAEVGANREVMHQLDLTRNVLAQARAQRMGAFVKKELSPFQSITEGIRKAHGDQAAQNFEDAVVKLADTHGTRRNYVLQEKALHTHAAAQALGISAKAARAAFKGVPEGDTAALETRLKELAVKHGHTEQDAARLAETVKYARSLHNVAELVRHYDLASGLNYSAYRDIKDVARQRVLQGDKPSVEDLISRAKGEAGQALHLHENVSPIPRRFEEGKTQLREGQFVGADGIVRRAAKLDEHGNVLQPESIVHDMPTDNLGNMDLKNTGGAPTRAADEKAAFQAAVVKHNGDINAAAEELKLTPERAQVLARSLKEQGGVHDRIYLPQHVFKEDVKDAKIAGQPVTAERAAKRAGGKTSYSFLNKRGDMSHLELRQMFQQGKLSREIETNPLRIWLSHVDRAAQAQANSVVHNIAADTYGRAYKVRVRKPILVGGHVVQGSPGGGLTDTMRMRQLLASQKLRNRIATLADQTSQEGLHGYNQAINEGFRSRLNGHLAQIASEMERTLTRVSQTAGDTTAQAMRKEFNRQLQDAQKSIDEHLAGVTKGEGDLNKATERRLKGLVVSSSKRAQDVVKPHEDAFNEAARATAKAEHRLAVAQARHEGRQARLDELAAEKAPRAQTRPVRDASLRHAGRIAELEQAAKDAKAAEEKAYQRWSKAVDQHTEWENKQLDAIHGAHAKAHASLHGGAEKTLAKLERVRNAIRNPDEVKAQVQQAQARLPQIEARLKELRAQRGTLKHGSPEHAASVQELRALREEQAGLKQQVEDGRAFTQTKLSPLDRYKLAQAERTATRGAAKAQRDAHSWLDQQMQDLKAEHFGRLGKLDKAGADLKRVTVQDLEQTNPIIRHSVQVDARNAQAKIDEGRADTLTPSEKDAWWSFHSQGADPHTEWVPMQKTNGDMVAVPAPIRDALEARHRVLADDKALRKLEQKFAKAQHAWKVVVTTINPGYHARNWQTDAWNMYVTNVPAWAIGAYTIKAAKLQKAAARAGKKLAAGQKLDREELNAYRTMERARVHSILSGLFRVDINEETKLAHYNANTAYGTIRRRHGKNIAATGVKWWAKGAQDVGRIREDNGRLAHWLYLTEHENMPAADAARKVIEAHFNYDDLSDTERHVFRNTVPFFTWSRKNIPLQFKQMVSRPGKMLAAPRAVENFEAQTNTKGDFPSDILRNEFSLKVPIPKALGGDKYLVPQIGLQDPYRLAADPKGYIFQQVTPFAKAPYELATGNSLDYGGKIGGTHPRTPINGPSPNGFLGHLLEKVPGLNYGMTERLAFGKRVHGPGVNPMASYLIGQIPAANFALSQNANIRAEQRGGRGGSIANYVFGTPLYKNDNAAAKEYATIDTENWIKQYIRGLRDEGKLPEAKKSKQSEYQRRLAALIQASGGR